MKKLTFFCVLLVFFIKTFAVSILIYMDSTQKDHLKAYGKVYEMIKRGYRVNWLLNYRGGSFLIEGNDGVLKIMNDNAVSYKIVDLNDIKKINDYIEVNNCSSVLLNKPTKIAVYTPDTANPWDDAVTLALEYAGIPYDKIYDEEILAGALEKYDWLHLHHEDFTGQFGKFYAMYSKADWYIKKKEKEEERAKKLGFKTVPELKKAVALKIREYVQNGGFLFAMCAATDTIDIALASLNTDIVPPEIDGTPIDPNYEKKLDFSNTFAFTNFKIITNPYVYEFSSIDVDVKNAFSNVKTFKLFTFSAKFDKIPTILTQDHERIIKDFLGQTTAFRTKYIKKDVLILGYINDKVAKYIHGIRGKGTFTFLGGHDPEDYAHLIGERPTDLRFHKNSPGYRLILNNVLFPSVKKEKLKT